MMYMMRANNWTCRPFNDDVDDGCGDDDKDSDDDNDDF